VVGIVRNPDHEPDIVAAGGQAAVLDLEQAEVDTVAEVLSGADVAIFAAGAGPGSGNARKDTVDRGAAALLADAAEQAGVRRHVQVGSMGADRAESLTDDSTFTIYLKAKWAAEEDLRRRDLDWTVLRPGGLTDDPGTGTVKLADKTGNGKISRDDVALVLAGLCDTPAAIGRTLELVGGDTPVRAALENL
jgi:uncharacterized protein YbjT (DUF2867 family)